MKQQIDRPIGNSLRTSTRAAAGTHARSVMTEFGRTIASEPAAGTEPDGFASATGEADSKRKKMYGFHGHFSSCSCVLFYGGGFKRASSGKTAERHPMTPLENAVNLASFTPQFSSRWVFPRHSITEAGHFM
jgi:hypothetical protein